MMQILFLGFLFVMGAVIGSFLCCQVRRAKLHEKGARATALPKRSICLHCHKQLKWHDNIPVVSWVILRGRCRFCHKKIGAAEVVSEVLVGLAFVMTGAKLLIENGGFEPGFNVNACAYFQNISGINWGIFATTLALIISLAALGIYDGLYGELPNLCLTISAIFAIILVALKVTGDSLPVLQALISAAVFGGIYLLLYLLSRGRWVGDGDWILAAIIGLALGRPFLSLFALFISNFLACIIMYPTVKKQRRSSSHLIYFGPFLVAAFVITESLSTIMMGLVSF